MSTYYNLIQPLVKCSVKVRKNNDFLRLFSRKIEEFLNNELTIINCCNIDT